MNKMDKKCTLKSIKVQKLYFNVNKSIATMCFIISLRNYACSNILKISPPKTESFQIKNLDILHIAAKNIDCRYALKPPYRGGSNEYPQFMFLSRNKKT